MKLWLDDPWDYFEGNPAGQLAEAATPSAEALPRFDPDLSVQRSRGYFALRYGPAPFSTILSPSMAFLLKKSLGRNSSADPSVSIGGVTSGPNWPVDGWETTVSQDGLGDIREYAVSSVLIQGRLRYPLMDDRLTPYIVGGVGGALTQTNDRTALGDSPPSAAIFLGRDRPSLRSWRRCRIL